MGHIRVRYGGRRSRPWALVGVAVLMVTLGCQDDGTAPSNGHFAAVGAIHVEVETDLPPEDRGHLHQSFSWESSGAWRLDETIGYRGRDGDVTTRRSRGDPSPLASHYQTLIRQLNEVRGLQLFIDDLPAELEPECGRGRSRYTLTLHDHATGDSIRWKRCADAPLFTVRSAEAGPDPAASRVVTAAQLARDFTLGDGSRSVYEGSHPFGTLDRGDDSPAQREEPVAFLAGNDGDPPQEWETFWDEHADGAPLPLEVDWDREMVVLAAVGRRIEAGDSVVVRRILSLHQEDRVEVFKRVPGDFCAPASRNHYPYHVVVAPRSADHVTFADVQEERVPCGVFP